MIILCTIKDLDNKKGLGYGVARDSLLDAHILVQLQKLLLKFSTHLTKFWPIVALSLFIALPVKISILGLREGPLITLARRGKAS